MLSPSVETIRLFLHVLAAAVWVGGQIVLAGIVPGLRKLGPDATKAAANGFARVAWPAFVLAFATGIWNLAAQDSGTSEYNATLGIKILLVIVAGFSAAQHSRSSNRAVIAATGAIGGVLSLLILFLGVLLTTPG